MKHTPGPWMAEEGIEGQGLRWVTGKNGEQVAQVYSDYKNPLEANARLIAAAPDLLATLQKVVDYHKYVQEKCIWHLEANAQVDLIDILRDTQAAIANAIGKQDRIDAQDRVIQLEEALRGLLNASSPYRDEGWQYHQDSEDGAWDLAWYQASRTLNNLNATKEG